MNNYIVKCDECENSFPFESVDIHEALVQVKDVSVVLVYFVCPHCNKIYKVSIQDRKYYELKEDLDKAKERFNKLKTKKQNHMYRMLYESIVIKKDRLASHVDRLNKIVNGKFVFDENQNIKYLP